MKLQYLAFALVLTVSNAFAQTIACTQSKILDEVEIYLTSYRKGRAEVGFCLQAELEQARKNSQNDRFTERDLVLQIAEGAMKAEIEANK